MRVSAATLLLAAAIGVTAHPSRHAHQHMHRSIEEREFIMAQKPVPSSSSIPPPPPTSTAPPPPPTTSAAAPAPNVMEQSSAPASQPTAAAASSPPAFCGGNPSRKRATAGEIGYQGNIGAPGQYGCNMMTVDSPSGFDYVSVFTNAAGEDQSCDCWLKTGPNGGINGFFSGNQVLTFDLPAGGTKYLVVEANTQGGCACAPGSVPLTSFGQFGSTWYEFDFADDLNAAWSGADASCLVAAQYGMDIPGLQVCGAGTCSTINQGGSGTNAFVAGTADEDGLGLNVAPGPLTVQVTVGYQG